MAWSSLGNHVGWAAIVCVACLNGPLSGAFCAEASGTFCAEAEVRDVRGLESPVSGKYAIVGSTLHVGDGRVIEDGVLWIEDRKLAAVGSRDTVPVPPGARVLDGSGLHVTPGLIDVDSGLFLEPEDRRVAGGASPRSVMDSLDLVGVEWRRVRAEGVTEVAVHGDVLPGGGALGALVRLSVPEVLARESTIVLGLTTPGASRTTTAERLEAYYRARDLFRAALDYGESWEAYWKAVEKYNDELRKYLEAKERAKAAPRSADPNSETKGNEAKPEAKPAPPPPKDERTLAPRSTDACEIEAPPEAGEDAETAETAEGEKEKGDSEKDKPAAPPAQPAPAAPKPPSPPKPPNRPSVDAGKEALSRALAGELLVMIRAEREDEIRYALKLEEEFGLRIAILGGTEAYRLAGLLGRAGCPVIVEPTLQVERALEYREHTEANASRLAAAGVTVAVASGGPSAGAGSRWLRLQAAVSVRGGLEPEAALQAITRVPATLLGQDPRIGTLEIGKDASLAVFDGEPLHALTSVVAVCVDGVLEPLPRRPLPASDWSESRPTREVHLESGGAKGILTAVKVPAEEPESGSLLVLKNAKVWAPGDGDSQFLEAAAVVIDGGRIREVLRSEEPLPRGTAVTVVDLDGRWILPGFIDAHSHVGVSGETDELALDDDGPSLLDAWDPWDEEIEWLLRRGVTSVGLCPGGGNVVSGPVSVVKLLPGAWPPRVVRHPAAFHLSLDPDLSQPRFPTSFAGALQCLREWVRREGASCARDRLQVLVEVPNRTAGERASLALEAVGATCVWVEGDSFPATQWGLARPEGRVVLRSRGLAARDLELEAAASLSRRGVDVAFGSSGDLLDPSATLALAVRSGLDPRRAIAALTSIPADILGLAGSLGVIRAGAEADLVVWQGDPLSLRAAVARVYVDGRLVYSLPAEGGVR